MSVDQRDVIDIISRDKKGEIVLTISDHLNWKTTSEHLSILQEKINTYLTFLESGEIYESYPDAKGHRIWIEIMFHCQPSPAALSFLSKVKPIVENAGFGFRFELFSATPFQV
jgi:hypothetical protein